MAQYTTDDKKLTNIASPTGVTGGDKPGQLQGEANRIRGEANAQLTKFLGTTGVQAYEGMLTAQATDELSDISSKGISDTGQMGEKALEAVTRLSKPTGEMTPDMFEAAARGQSYHPSETKLLSEVEKFRALESEGITSGPQTNAAITAAVKKYTAQWPGLADKFRQIAVAESEKALYGDKQVYGMWIDDALRRKANGDKDDLDKEYQQWRHNRGLPDGGNSRVAFQEIKLLEDKAKIATDTATVMLKNNEVSATKASANFDEIAAPNRQEVTEDILALMKEAHSADGQPDMEIVSESSVGINDKMESFRAAELAALAQTRPSFGTNSDAYNAKVKQVNTHWNETKALLKNPLELSKWHQSNLFIQESKQVLENNAALASGIQGRIAIMAPETGASFRNHFGKVFTGMKIPAPINGQVREEDRKRIKQYFAMARDPLMTSAMFFNIIEQSAAGDSVVLKESAARARSAFTHPMSNKVDVEKMITAVDYGNPEAIAEYGHLMELVGTLDTGVNRKPNDAQVTSAEVYTKRVQEAHSKGTLQPKTGAARLNQIMNVVGMMPEDSATLVTAQITNNLATVLFNPNANNGVVSVLSQKAINNMKDRFPITLSADGKLTMQPYIVTDDMGATLESQQPPEELVKALETANSYLPIFKRASKHTGLYNGVDGAKAIADAWNSGDMTRSSLNNLVQTQQQIKYTNPVSTVPKNVEDTTDKMIEKSDAELEKKIKAAHAMGISVDEIARATRRDVSIINNIVGAV